MFPIYRVKLRFCCFFFFFCFFFVLFKAGKTKLTLHHMGKMFNIRFGIIRFGFWRVTFFLSIFFFFFLPLENFGMDGGFCAVDDLPRAH